MKYISSIALVLTFSMTVSQASEPALDNGPDAAVMELTDGPIQPNNVFNVLTYAAPRSWALHETGLRESGLQAGAIIPRSDEIRIFASRDVMNAAPLARIWLNEREGGAYWFITGGEGPASDFVIPEGAAVVVWTRAGTTPVNWTNVFR